MQVCSRLQFQFVRISLSSTDFCCVAPDHFYFFFCIPFYHHYLIINKRLYDTLTRPNQPPVNIISWIDLNRFSIIVGKDRIYMYILEIVEYAGKIFPKNLKYAW